MVNVMVSGETNKAEIIKGFILNGLDEEKKRFEYTLSETQRVLREYEAKYKISTVDFLKEFKNGEIEENEDTFSWESESCIEKELKEKLALFSSIEICQS
jgi:hypothetical protein